MNKGFEQIFGKDAFDANMKALSTVSQSVKAIAAETGDYAKKSIEEAASN